MGWLDFSGNRHSDAEEKAGLWRDDAGQVHYAYFEICTTCDKKLGTTAGCEECAEAQTEGQA